MTLSFAWCPEGTPFDLSLHDRCDLEILSLTIEQQEGEAALTTVVIPAAKYPVFKHRHAYICQDKILLFSGRLTGLPLRINNDRASLEFTAEPLNARKLLEDMAPVLKQPPFWDEAFVDPADQDNPSEWLEARSALFAWDRVTGTVCLSDLFQGRHEMDLTGIFFADSLKVRLAETPLASLSMTVTAEWIQEAGGEVSLGSRIAAAFPGGMINTLTPHALQATWPKVGQEIGRSGYWVIDSHLKDVMPPFTGILNIYPTVTPEYRSWDKTNQRPKAHRLRRAWMTGKLVLGWYYRQMRRESVHFTLDQKTQLDKTIRPQTRAIRLRLQSLPLCVNLPASAGTFFLSQRGRQAVDHALERARACLAASARCLELEIMIPFEAGLALSLDHSVRLVDERIPGGRMVGKVVAYRLCQEGGNAYAWVRLAASPGAEPEPFPQGEPLFYVEPDYGNTGIKPYHQTPSGLVYRDYSAQRPTEGLAEIEGLSVADLLQEVVVTYDAERQCEVLQQLQYPVRQTVKEILEEHPTLVSPRLLSLKTQAVADHCIYLDTEKWSAPRQINLGGE